MGRRVRGIGFVGVRLVGLWGFAAVWSIWLTVFFAERVRSALYLLSVHLPHVFAHFLAIFFFEHLPSSFLSLHQPSAFVLEHSEPPASRWHLSHVVSHFLSVDARVEHLPRFFCFLHHASARVFGAFVHVGCAGVASARASSSRALRKCEDARGRIGQPERRDGVTSERRWADKWRLNAFERFQPFIAPGVALIAETHRSRVSFAPAPSTATPPAPAR